jgi:TolB-like protein/Tfp pilus assembly protein PilF
MTSERWQQVNDLFLAAAERAAEDRTTFLQTACDGDEGLRREVESLIASYERAENFIEAPAFEVAPDLLTNEQAGAMVGETIGRYRIESLIGVGGMGEVYLARDEQLARKVALKFLPERLTANKTQLSRFKSEARAASALNHPNILTVYEIGTEGNRHFIATEFIEGVTLRAALSRGKMSVHDALEIAVQVGSALAAAHEAGVVHRDIKPENIMLRPDGYVKVLDFGLAKLTEQKSASDHQGLTVTNTQHTHAGMLLGTPRYMSPEQTRGEKADARSDIWSLAVVMYEMVAGIPPFYGDTPSDCIASILRTEPPPLSRTLADAPTNLESILKKALQKNKDERYQRIAEILADLRGLKRKLEQQASAPKIRTAGMWAAAVAAVAIVSLAISFFIRSPWGPRARSRADERAPAIAKGLSMPANIPEKSIAVLPFESLSRDPDNAYFADGIQDEILTRLSKIADLKVISRTSSQNYKSAPANLPDIARQLGVAHVLEGSVQKSGDMVRVNVQLIKAANDSHVWADTFDRKLTDILSVETEVAKTIADQLGAKLTRQEEQVVAAKPTDNPEAYDAYLKGRYFWNKRTGGDIRKAIEYFKQAIANDPNYALAYAGLAQAWMTLPSYSGGPPSECSPQAKAFALKALSLNEALSDAVAVLAAVKAEYDFDFSGARTDYKRAIQLNPNDATAHHWFAADVLASGGDHARELAEMKRALELDPLSLVINTNLGNAYLHNGRLDDAIAQFRKTIEMDPHFDFAQTSYAVALEVQGKVPEATVQYEKAAAMSDDPIALGMLGRAYGIAGRKDEARKIYDKLLQLRGQRYTSAYSLVIAALGLGDRNEALNWLEEGYRGRDGNNINQLRIDPLLAPLRGDPRFEAVAEKIVPAREFAAASLPTGIAAVPYKSIAVLPFENLSRDPDNAFFTDGVQDEILTDLARIADLKVISRTSVLQYKSDAKRNLRQIANELGVAHVVEGSVQRVRNRVRVNAQLIDARNDTHLWAQTYDRDLADVFAIQSEIAKAIADQLQAKLSPGEKSAIERAPTTDITAFDLYSRAKNLLVAIFFSDAKANLLKAIELLNQAVARDPSFFDAYCQLAYAHDALYFFGWDHTSSRVALAEAAIEAAFRLGPDAGETHLARAWNLYYGYLDYNGALAELEVARQSLPNAARIFLLMGYVQRRQGRWEESIRSSERAVDLDPRNVDTRIQTSFTYAMLRRYRDQETVLDRALAIVPDDAASKTERALADLNWKADTRPLRQAIDSIQATNPGAMSKIANAWIICALSERDTGAAKNALIALGEKTLGLGENVPVTRLFLEGVIARMRKDDDKARAAFTAARAEQEKTIQAQPNYAPALCVLGLIDAGLGRKEEALREGRRAVELLPVEKDAMNGPAMIKYLAVIATWVGDKDLACEQLAAAVRVPGPLSYGQLKLMPFWDPLRGDSRFEKIVASLAPKAQEAMKR